MIRFHLLASAVALLLEGCNAPNADSANAMVTVKDHIVPITGSSTTPSESTPQNPLSTKVYGGADHEVINSSLKRELVGIAQVDGKAITDVQMVDRCRTKFKTAGAAIEINWAAVGNFAAQEADGVVSLPIGAHTFTVRDAAVSRRMDGSMGLLADDCGG